MSFAVYPKHESYTDSGIDWIGQVPSSWSVEPGRQCLYESNEKNIGMKESTVLSLSYGRVIVKDEDKLTGLVPESFETYQVVQPGDIIIRGTDLQNDMTSLRTGLARDTGIITSAYINLRPKAEIDPKFLHYLLHSYDVKKVFYALGSGLRQNLSYEDFKYLRLPIPNPEEQRAIAGFLDGKCAKIDEAVRIKEEQIKLLAERRQILVQQAVTRGMNPDAPMKDSGIDWIGQIPAHWEMKRLRHLANLFDGDRGPNYPSPTDLVDEGILFLSSKNIVNGSLDFSIQNFITSAKFRALGRGKLQRDDIIITMRGTTGHTAIFVCDFETGFINAQMLIIRCQDIVSPNFLHQFTTTSAWKNQIAILAYGSAQQQLSSQILKGLWVAVPPFAEQTVIMQHLEQLHLQFKNAISIKEDQITALKEYKTSLINAAVTGEIKVI
jgi:type I restriction enzyme S subunit